MKSEPHSFNLTTATSANAARKGRANLEVRPIKPAAAVQSQDQSNEHPFAPVTHALLPSLDSLCREVEGVVARALRGRRWLLPHRKDLIQVGLLAALEVVERFDPSKGSTPMAYAMACAGWKIKDYYISQATQYRYEMSWDARSAEQDEESFFPEAVDPGAVGADALVAQKEARCLIRAALGALGPQDRELALARIGYQHTHDRRVPWQELADRFGQPSSQLQRRYRSILGHLQNKLSLLR